MAALKSSAGVRFKRWASVWLSDPATYPIIGIMGVAFGLYGTMAVHELRHPVAKWTKKARATDDAPDDQATAHWNDHAARRVADSRNHLFHYQEYKNNNKNKKQSGASATATAAADVDADARVTVTPRDYSADRVEVGILPGLNRVIRKLVVRDD